MGLYEPSGSLHPRRGMEEAARIRTWLRQTLESQGLTVEQWAARSGVAKSTIFRALKPNYEFVTSSRTLSRLASAIGAQPPQFLTNVRLERVWLPVRYRVQAGLWFEVDTEEPPEQALVEVPASPRFAAFPQWLEKVVGDSVNQKIPPGHYVHVVDAIELGYAPKDGDWVVVERRRDQGRTRERSIKQIELKGGHVKLWPRSTNPKWSAPLDLAAGGKPGDIVVEIVGLVIQAIDTNF